MTCKIKILPAIENRYIDPKIIKPIAKSNYNQFIKNVENLINELNDLLNENDGLYCVLYDNMCMIINHDLMTFENLSKENLNSILEKTIMFVYDYYSKIEREVTESEVEKLDSIFKFFEISLKKYKVILDHNCGTVGKMRGILMEALGVSLFGNKENFSENFFIWDFNAFEKNKLIKYCERETTDIYYEKNGKSYICEIKCRPKGVDESQVDFINHLNSRLDEVESVVVSNIILHGGTADDFNFEKISFREKLANFTIYPKENIDELLKKI
ncbi:hypothetical protein [Staphylococcus kloosii]|jgi:hypothetical protein|uniref:hypothetical protein n=1 Tax=Staphylococcus kloosii TaxID=29384 RepID=UPI00189CD61B|nr:hypothetical protein [Staphylococcus kloosii]MBF7023654.1 hypothetical protein [Staphylococcus kloosii]